MTPEQPTDPEVQRILALKRHEQPPPAFFRGFSEQIIDRIQAAGPAPRPTLRQRLSMEFYGVPIYICGAGLVVCGLLVVGLIGSLRVGPAQRAVEESHPELVDVEPAHSLVPPQSRTPSLNSPTKDPGRDLPPRTQPAQARLIPETPPK
jgi:hypothetical protein